LGAVVADEEVGVVELGEHNTPLLLQVLLDGLVAAAVAVARALGARREGCDQDQRSSVLE